MPFEMGGYLQSVVVQRTVYIGGGVSSSVNKLNYIVMEYDMDLEKWDKLAKYKTRLFAMTAINNQLVLVGGVQSDRSYSKLLGIWRADSKKWIHPYPDMPTACTSPSVVTYKEWLVVVGGVSGIFYQSSVHVMNTTSKQWHTVSTAPAPIAMSHMWTAVVGDLCYFMGGWDNGSGTDMVYSVSLPALVNSKREKDLQIWKRISGLGLHYSTPLSIGGALLALGGRDIKDRQLMTAILHYRPETGEWVKVGDLPSPQCAFTCAKITDGEILVAGGRDGQTFFKDTKLARL